MTTLTDEQRDQLERLRKLPSMRSPYFTVVFEGDIGNIPGNPFKVESVWGKPVTVARGDILSQIDDLCQSIETKIDN